MLTVTAKLRLFSGCPEFSHEGRWRAAGRISHALAPSSALSWDRSNIIYDDDEKGELIRARDYFDMMYNQFLQLSEFSQPIGALAISRVVVCLWGRWFPWQSFVQSSEEYADI